MIFEKLSETGIMLSSEESFELNSSSVSCSSFNDIISSIPPLSDELEYFGLRPLPQLKYEEDSVLLQTQVTSLVSSLIDTIWNLLHLHRSALQQCDEVEDVRHRVAYDNKNLQSQVDRLKTELSNKERLLSAASEKERRLTTECDKLRCDLRTGKDEVHRLMAQVTWHDCQHTHELRKKEHEVLHVQEQLRRKLGLPCSLALQVMKEKQQENNGKPAHEVCSSSSTLDMSSDSRGKTIMPKEQEDLYRKVINKFENNNRRLVDENIKLCDMYCKLHTNLGFLTQQFTVLLVSPSFRYMIVPHQIFLIFTENT
ncbi:Afadin- and alpha-actinin-binding protein [Zootermopsis nevadensis]|uniref:Afadin-and alpha-actinin-binding protein n=1 Tax=Zootermopsis nevadensis TaxID=136037 RepID=A0A067RBF4_ZOONE|nr:Afadin- and alpha-actinin-binding protein [Zootermopsis nevadensis]